MHAQQITQKLQEQLGEHFALAYKMLHPTLPDLSLPPIQAFELPPAPTLPPKANSSNSNQMADKEVQLQTKLDALKESLLLEYEELNMRHQVALESLRQGKRKHQQSMKKALELAKMLG